METGGTEYLPTLWSRLQGLDDTVLSPADRTALLRQEILQNIIMILNSRSHLPENMFDGDDACKYSVLGLGLHDFCGHSHSSTRLNLLKEQIRQQIIHFEPRLDPDSLQIELLDPENEIGPNSPNYVNLEIRARLNHHLSHEVFSCISRIDLDAGSSSISSPDSGSPRR